MTCAVAWSFMKAAVLLILTTACGAYSGLPEHADTQEFVFNRSNGSSFSLVLPADWRPEYQGDFLRINPRNRVMSLDVILIEPRFQQQVAGLEFVRLARRNRAATLTGTYDLWLEEGVAEKLKTNRSQELEQVAPQTWLRANDFRVLLVRDEVVMPSEDP